MANATARAATLRPWTSIVCCSPRPAASAPGVEMAIKALAWMVRAFEPPVYCYHEIVHNQPVVERFEAARAWCSSTTSPRCRPAGPLMLSAHGSAPEVVAAARANGGYVVDAVCPLVTKVHHEVKVRAGKGYQIVYVGHDGHEEAVGTMAVAPDAIHRVESVDDVSRHYPSSTSRSRCSPRRRCRTATGPACSTPPRQRFPTMWMPGRSDLCFATTNRQSALWPRSPPRCDAVVVIGSANSSNTRALEKLARELPAAAGVPGQRSRRAARRPRRARSASPPAPRPPRSSSRR